MLFRSNILGLELTRLGPEAVENAECFCHVPNFCQPQGPKIKEIRDPCQNDTRWENG